MNALRETFKKVKRTLGCVNCLVNAAGVAIGGPLTDHTEETINKILSINVRPRLQVSLSNPSN